MRHPHGIRLYLSHRWRYSQEYKGLVGMLDRDPDFLWCNYSVCEETPFLTTSPRKLEEGLRDQIKRAHVVLVVGAMDVPHSEPMLTEIEFALEFKKPLIWVIPRGAQRLPGFVDDVADKVVGWSTRSIVDAVERFA
ncbi:MAG TPA: TIR domain-containing protein [Longimicrobium sp.]|nr:TIR domain-containing protein [Longimicrobium sp.]